MAYRRAQAAASTSRTPASASASAVDKDHAEWRCALSPSREVIAAEAATISIIIDTAMLMLHAIRE
jgi:hypothetical protein